MEYNGNNIHATLSKILEKLGSVESRIEALTVQVTMTNGRIRALEGWRMFLVGAVATIILLVGWYFQTHK